MDEELFKNSQLDFVHEVNYKKSEIVEAEIFKSLGESILKTMSDKLQK